MSELTVIGLNHRTAPLELREQFALSSAQVLKILRDIKRREQFQESLLLSTCNRTEFYFVPTGTTDPLERLLDCVAEARGKRPLAAPANFYRHEAIEAVRHLFEVAASLDSQIVGEHQILGQVKQAYHLAVEARTASFLLNKTMHRAFRVGKRIFSETALGLGSASVAQAAVELARQIFSSLHGKAVLLVGAGEMAEAAARALIRHGAARVIVANRTPQRAARLAEALLRPPRAKGGVDKVEKRAVSCPALLRMNAEWDDSGRSQSRADSTDQSRKKAALTTEAMGLEDIASAIEQVDLVISSTGATEPVLTWTLLGERLRRRRHSLLMIDIGVPRDIEQRLGTLSNVFLYNIDDLNQLVSRNRQRRQQEIPLALSIVEDEVQQFAAWLSSLQVAPTIQQLQEHFETLQKAQLERYGRQFSEQDRQQLERYTDALCNRILHQPLAYLRSMSAGAPTSEVLAGVETIRRMFNLNGNGK